MLIYNLQTQLKTEKYFVYFVYLNIKFAFASEYVCTMALYAGSSQFFAIESFILSLTWVCFLLKRADGTHPYKVQCMCTMESRHN